jgi:hypothetical protein
VGSLGDDRVGRVFQLFAHVGVHPFIKGRVVSFRAINALANSCRTNKPKDFGREAVT